MAKLKIIIQDSLVNDFISSKTNTFLVETWPMSYKRFVETDIEGNIVLDSDNIAVPKQFDELEIISIDGKFYEAKVDKIEAIIDMVSSVDNNGKEILDEDGKAVMQPAVLLYKGKEWPQFLIEYTISDVKEVPAFDTPIKKNPSSIIQDNWIDYKEGRRGQKTIPEFEKASTLDVTIDDQFALIKRFNPNYMKNLGTQDKQWMRVNLDDFFNNLTNFTLSELPTNIYEAADFYEGYMTLVDPSYRQSVNRNMFITFNLFAICPEFYFPNLFVMNFIALQRFADLYNLELPEIPARTNWRGRCMYYMDVCKIVYQFRIDNDLTPAELNALMFEYSQGHADRKNTELPEPSQAWLIGGTSGDAEKDADYRFWQANPDTKRGDILIHYEKYPTKAITAVWRAEENGIVDPFFGYYSNTYAGHRIDVPPITLDELKGDEFFKKPNSPVGKLINKNFQGVNGWTVSGDDYKHFLEIWKVKGFETGKLPKLYAPELPKGITIVHERDVSDLLLRPMLNSMGWNENEDFKPEVHFKAGRGSAKRPDFCLHLQGEGEDTEAKVIFECKLYMKNSKEIEANFTQGRSYAKWGNAQILVLCDKQQILVYERHHGSFDRNKFKKFYWGEVMGGNSDKFNELKKLLS
jgi:hypothetical protein